MSATSLASDRTGQQLDAVLDRLTTQVRLRIPDLHCRVHHGANDHYAWWVVARLSNPGDESKIVDISIECRSPESGIDIHVDLAREDGTVLRELPADGLGVPPRTCVNGVLLSDAIRHVEDFLLGQVECLVGELS
jgi:hypothetical protein